jgi:hypothetical protein
MTNLEVGLLKTATTEKTTVLRYKLTHGCVDILPIKSSPYVFTEVLNVSN